MQPCGAFVHSVKVRHRWQRGVSLVELMVSLAIGLLVGLVAIGVWTLAHQGFTTVNASSQLRDTARFSVDFIGRMALQAGFQDVLFASTQDDSGPAPEPDISGFNNASIVSANPLYQFTPRSARSSAYGSDILILRFQTPQTFPGSGVVDKSVVNCLGSVGAEVAKSRYDRVVNVLYVDSSLADLALMCRSGTVSYANGAFAVDFPGTPQPIVQGVENFQVLYGTDGVSPGAATPGAADQVPERYLRADQINGPAAWRRVRSLRIGLVLRGPANSAVATAATTLYPLGSTFATNSDPGTAFTPSSDGRLRQVVTYTIHLRNSPAP